MDGLIFGGGGPLKWDFTVLGLNNGPSFFVLNNLCLKSYLKYFARFKYPKDDYGVNELSGYISAA